MRNTGHYIVLCLTIFLAIFTHCAKVAAPTGGDKDTLSPVVRKSLPENASTHFSSREIEIVFNEFVQLKDVNNKLVISPPMKGKPQMKLKGKALVISLEDSLLSNTTYTFNFNDAIVDNNENNPLENFEYVFSTGNTVDSLSVNGQLLDALSLEPAEGIYVMLYDQLNDSAPITSRPLYMSKTNKKGEFRINHLKTDTFRVFALKDVNANFRYDLSSEYIGFITDPVFIRTPVDTTVEEAKEDSLRATGLLVATFDLRLFKEEEKKRQYLTSTSRPNKDQLVLIFSQPLMGPTELQPLDTAFSQPWYILEKNQNSDTLQYWITDSILYSRDRLELVLTYPGADSSGTKIAVKDTMRLRYVEPVRPRKTKSAGTGKVKEYPISSSVTKGSTIDLNGSLKLSTPSPVMRFDTSKIHLCQLIDSAWVEQSYTPMRDSFSLRTFRLKHSWLSEEKYRLQLFPGALTSYGRKTNDTIEISFQAQKTEYYGNTILQVRNVRRPLLIQMLNEKNITVRQDFLVSDRTIQYPLLRPGKYRFRAIFDDNRNKKWDTGSYLEHRQPEAVIYFGEVNDVRSNWDLELTWTIPDEK